MRWKKFRAGLMASTGLGHSVRPMLRDEFREFHFKALVALARTLKREQIEAGKAS